MAIRAKKALLKTAEMTTPGPAVVQGRMDRHESLGSFSDAAQHPATLPNDKDSANTQPSMSGATAPLDQPNPPVSYQGPQPFNDSLNSSGMSIDLNDMSRFTASHVLPDEVDWPALADMTRQPQPLQGPFTSVHGGSDTAQRATETQGFMKTSVTGRQDLQAPQMPRTLDWMRRFGLETYWVET